MIRKLLLTLLCALHASCGCAEVFKESSIQEVLSYWFGHLQNEEDYPREQSKIWFGGGPVIDQEIRSRFGDLVQDAANHKLDSWKQTLKGRLALIVLIDQFSRNIYRGMPEAFASDSMAQELSIEGLALGEDLKLFPVERVFFYLPLEHSENLGLQKLSVRKFQELAELVPFSLSSIFKSYADYAVRHYVIIEKFGRFPHRNIVLGRESTEEEVEFLKGPNSSF